MLTVTPKKLSRLLAALPSEADRWPVWIDGAPGEVFPRDVTKVRIDRERKAIVLEIERN